MPPCGSEDCSAMAHAYGAQRLRAGDMMRTLPIWLYGSWKRQRAQRVFRQQFLRLRLDTFWLVIPFVFPTLHGHLVELDIPFRFIRWVFDFEAVFCARQCIERAACLPRLLCHSARQSKDGHIAPDHWRHLARLQQLCFTIHLWRSPAGEAQLQHSRELDDPTSLQGVLQCSFGDPWH